MCCATVHLGGKMTKSATAIPAEEGAKFIHIFWRFNAFILPGNADGAVRTVKMEGSG